ncbi:MAG: hypothetical protein PSX36_04305 [bacterium]|nr:hypothetical protein [bacterium]
MILLPFLAFTQAPGYMGKKCVVGYGFNISPAINNATPRDNHLNTIHELYLDYVIGNKWLVGLGARYYKTIYDNKANFSDSDVHPEGSYTINGISLCLNFKYYKRNYVAPWGRYFMISPVLNMAKTSYDPSMHTVGRVNGHDTLYLDFGPSPVNYYHFDIMLGWGRSRVIADRFTVDYGYNLQLWSLITALNEVGQLFPASLAMNNYIEETHKWRVHGINRFNFFIKLGYLF